MKCPYCGNAESRVVDSRSTQNGTSIRRRRECIKCHRRFTTYEYVQAFEMMVIKRNGQREQYDRNKLIKGIALACRKRPVSFEEIEKMVERIENRLATAATPEVDSQLIGSMVMEELKGADEVAYVRFASVYRDFKDIEEFKSELEHILSDRKKRKGK